ncbi:hypothetical protein PGIGA_G00224710 [Pangasianodon gigas]|uniref:Uncharacterized protein n=1 Tax=Pangasianodon gigas TaxID=30993 RepID=A0ACC5WKH4_PANGG|nr:hypothetical protein [Pangasianodon gigas]
MAATTPPKVIFEHEGVFIHSNTEESEDQDSLISGFLRIIDKDGETFVEYKPVEDTVDLSNMLCACKDSSSVVEWTQRPHRPLDQQLSYETEWDMVNTVSFKRKIHTNGEGGSNHFNERNKWAFSFNVSELRTVTVKDEGWSYLIFCLRDDAKLPAIHFHQGGSQGFLDGLRKSVHLSESPDDKNILVVATYNKAISQSFENLLDDSNYGLVQKFRKDPYTTTFGGFSKVTNYIFDAFRPSESECQQRPAEEVADILGELIPGLEINQQEEPGFEVITRVDLGTRPDVQRREPVMLEDWTKHQDSEGRVSNVPHLKHLIFKGGLCHAVRKEAWKFLLGYYPWDSTHEERKNLQKRKTDEYFRMKLQWKSVSEEQEKRNSRLRDYKSLIEKDVNRTDRNNKFYEGLDNPGLILLHDILMTYCMYDFDLGYVQGMSDLLSPILYVMENEVDAFWCFVSFMDQMVDLGTRPDVQRREPVMLEDWTKHKDSEGRVSNVPHLKHLIFKGGLCHAVRKEAWKFLLGYYPWDSTHEERKNLQKRKTDEYFRMKLQWKSVSEEQEKRNSRLRDYKSLIEKDVNRTDRNNKFYEGLDNPGLILLHDILMTYCMYDFDLGYVQGMSDLLSPILYVMENEVDAFCFICSGTGYVQGMSDLLSPILYVMENEVDAFWCFVSFMDQMHENFEEQMQGMKTQLIQLSTLLRLLDLAFWNYLEAQDSGYLYFCFRWLLIRFKRELYFQDVLRFWEVMWTGLPCQNFHLLVCCAILDSEKQKIMDRHYGFNEILKHINELSLKLDIEEILIKSEAIYMQLKNCKDLPHSVSEILGLNTVAESSTLETSEYSVLESPQTSPRSAQRQDEAYSNGHGLLQETSHNTCKVGFIS